MSAMNSPLKGKRSTTSRDRSTTPSKTTVNSSAATTTTTRQRRIKDEQQTCPSYHNGSLPTLENVQRLRTLTAPHVESYNFFLEYGLSAGIKSLEHAEIDLLPPSVTAKATTPRDLRQQQQQEEGAPTPMVDHAQSLQDVSTIQFWVEDVTVARPVKSFTSGTNTSTTSKFLYPREARERGCMYSGTMSGTFCIRLIERRNYTIIPNKVIRIPNKIFGDMPIMVLSKSCHLHNSTPSQLAKLKEEANEFGGYFIVNGIERCIRMLQIPRRNYATAIQRSNYKNRGTTYTDLGVVMRCSRHNHDQSSIANTIHYLTTGGVTIKFIARKQEFLIPLIIIIRALSGGGGIDGDSSTIHGTASSFDDADMAGGGGENGFCMGITDEELYRRIVQGDHTNTFLVARANLLLQDARARFGSVNTPNECLAYLGERFRRLSQRAETTSNIDIGHYMIRNYILIHLPNYKDKLECLLFMLRKLYAFAAGDCGVDNADSLQNQEILLPGHLLSTFVKEKFDEFIQALRLGIVGLLRKDYAGTCAKLQAPNFWSTQVDRFSMKSTGGIGKKVAHLLSTGNIVSTTGLDLMQVSGYTIVAERLNFLRYCAHFRSVHRGSFFMEMKTTAVRKLLPDQWGFLCPVHTPDGGPCGLLSHMALKAVAMAYPAELTAGSDNRLDLDDLLISLGVAPVGAGGRSADGHATSTYLHIPVTIDGRSIGGASPTVCNSIAIYLRKLKVETPAIIPPTIEIALIPPGNAGAPYPGLFLFTGAARLVRPVLQRASGQTEMIGPLEQAFMDIACLDEDIREGITTHQELDPMNMLSLIASLTPFSDQNQSPRNMYQCQMGKQTMGTPCHSLPYRSDNKLYKLQTPQAPIVQTGIHGMYKMDEYPNGTNAVVAVLSYTGFDMEDAMILNKSSYERGFGHASVYKTIEVDLKEEVKGAGASTASSEVQMRFGNKQKQRGNDFVYTSLGEDGLPNVGDRVEEGDPLYCIVDSKNNFDKVGKHKEREYAYVQTIRTLGSDNGKATENKLSMTLRFPRNPVIGDKFSSRHGQKGVLSILWPNEDMPFSESGISPDVIINPHAFPSRMTIGMLVESMAGKSGALHGVYQDATPFTFHESGDKVSVDYFGEQLQAAGYNYYGSEALYSGVSGCVMEADLFIGVVYYQRLRHMVSDKYQVRATGPVNELTRQPIKGRKKGGGIRLGEMERDSLLSHGAAFLLQDRLLNCSDRHVAYACCRCGDLLMPTTERCVIQTTGQSANEAINKPKLRLFCRTPSCIEATKRVDGNDAAVEPIVLPYVYRYLVNELAGMNIKMKLEIS